MCHGSPSIKWNMNEIMHAIVKGDEDKRDSFVQEVEASLADRKQAWSDLGVSTDLRWQFLNDTVSRYAEQHFSSVNGHSKDPSLLMLGKLREKCLMETSARSEANIDQSNAPECTWFFSDCDEQGRIVKIKKTSVRNKSADGDNKLLLARIGRLLKYLRKAINQIRGLFAF